MIDLSRVRNYYVACGYTDLRRGIDGLAAIVMSQYGMELREDSLFLFCGRRTDRIKALYWSGDGCVLIYEVWSATPPLLRQRISVSFSLDETCLRPDGYPASLREAEESAGQGQAGAFQPYGGFLPCRDFSGAHRHAARTEREVPRVAGRMLPRQGPQRLGNHAGDCFQVRFHACCILRRSTAAGAVPAVAKRRQRSVVSIGCLRLNHHSVVLGCALQNCVGRDLVVHNHGGPTARIAL